jgi:hypothetical protein
MALVVDPNTGRLIDEKELGRTKEQRDNKKDIDVNLYDGKDETDIQLSEAEDNNEVSGATAFVAGLGSGAIKTADRAIPRS